MKNLKTSEFRQQIYLQQFVLSSELYSLVRFWESFLDLFLFVFFFVVFYSLCGIYNKFHCKTWIFQHFFIFHQHHPHHLRGQHRWSTSMNKFSCTHMNKNFFPFFFFWFCGLFNVSVIDLCCPLLLFFFFLFVEIY